MKKIKTNMCQKINDNEYFYDAVEGLSILDSVYPALKPKHTIIFYSAHNLKCNLLTVGYYRHFIKKVFKWAIKYGIEIFIVDYTTSFGLLALETLSKLKARGEQFFLYCVKSSRITERRDYHIIHSSDIKLINLVTKSDYDYIYLKPEDVLNTIYPNVGVHCTEGKIWILQEWISSCD